MGAFTIERAEVLFARAVMLKPSTLYIHLTSALLKYASLEGRPRDALLARPACQHLPGKHGSGRRRARSRRCAQPPRICGAVGVGALANVWRDTSEIPLQGAESVSSWCQLGGPPK